MRAFGLSGVPSRLSSQHSPPQVKGLSESIAFQRFAIRTEAAVERASAHARKTVAELDLDKSVTAALAKAKATLEEAQRGLKS